MQQSTAGIITAVLTEPGQQSGISVNANEADQRYEVGVHHPLQHSADGVQVENEATGRKTTIYEQSIAR